MITRTARRERDRELARQIGILIGEGVSTDDIAAKLEIQPHRVRRLADRHGIVLPKPHTKRLAFRCNRRRSQVIFALADKADVSVAVMLDRIVGSVVDDGVQRAERHLGKLALPPRGREKSDA